MNKLQFILTLLDEALVIEEYAEIFLLEHSLKLTMYLIRKMPPLNEELTNIFVRIIERLVKIIVNKQDAYYSCIFIFFSVLCLNNATLSKVNIFLRLSHVSLHLF